MLNRIQKLLFGAGLTLFLFACSSSIMGPDVPDHTPSLFTQSTITSTAITVMPSPTLPLVLDPTEELRSEPSPIPFLVPTATPTEIPTIKIVSCQDLPINNSAPLVGAGHILYYSPDMVGVGRISLTDLSQRQLFESLGSPAYGATLSPERNKIAFHRFGEDLILLDLLSGTTALIPFNKTWVLANPSWSQDGRIIAHTTGDGILKFYSFDPLTLSVEEKKKTPAWPDVAYTTTNNLPGSGFIAVDPTETFAFYTEWESNTNYMINFVLRNIQDGSELWRNEDVGHEYYNAPGVYAEPRWNEDGSQAILALPQTHKRAFTLLLSVTTDGQETEIVRLTHLSNGDNRFQIRYLEWSPDQRFIHFGLFETSEAGPGYILDTHVQTVYEICEPKFVQGWWLPVEEGSHLLYLADGEHGERTLNLLDVTTWQTQQLLVTDSNFQVWNVIGWTPLDTP